MQKRGHSPFVSLRVQSHESLSFQGRDSLSSATAFKFSSSSLFHFLFIAALGALETQIADEILATM